MSHPYHGLNELPRRGRLGSGSTLRRSRQAHTLPVSLSGGRCVSSSSSPLSKMLLLYHELRCCQQKIRLFFRFVRFYPCLSRAVCYTE